MTTLPISTSISCFRSSASFAAIALTASTIYNCLLHLLLFQCHIQIGIFLFLNFKISSSISTWCSLAFSATFNSCSAAMRRRLSVSLFLVIGITSFFETLFSSYVSACSWHCSFCSFDSLLLLGMLFWPAVGYALLGCFHAASCFFSMRHMRTVLCDMR